MSRISRFIALLLALVGPGAAQVVLPANAHDGNVGPLVAGTVYFATGTVVVPSGQTLTAQPGAAVAFDAGGRLDVQGTLQAIGTAGSPIVLTSACDGSAIPGSVPLPPGFTCTGAAAPGDWDGLTFGTGSDASVLDFVEVRFAGAGGAASIALTGADLVLSHVTVRDGAGAALDVGSSHPLVDQCHFASCQRAVIGVPLAAVPGFTSNTSQGIAEGSYIRIDGQDVHAATTIGPLNTLDGTGVLVVDDSITGTIGNTVTLAAGTIFKLTGPGVRFSFRGGIIANGTAAAPVVFTSLADDDHGGDTENDGATGGAPGDWGQVEVQTSVGQMTHVLIRYAGRNTNGNPYEGLDIKHVAATLTSSAVERCLGKALVTSLAAEPTVRDCRFDLNGAPPIDIQLRALPGFRHVTAQGNTGGDYLRIVDGVFPASNTVTIFPFNYPGETLVSSVTLSASAGRALVLEAGVILKFEGSKRLQATGGRLDLRGTGFDPVVLTTLADDGYGGDTNGDADATVPVTGSGWTQLLFSTASVLSTVEHVIVRYAGVVFNSPVRVTSAAMVTMRHIRAEHCMGAGLHVSSHVGDAAGWVAFANTGPGIRLTNGSFSLVHATTVGNGQVGIERQGGYTGNIVSTISWGNSSGNYSGVGAFQLYASCGSPTHAGMQNNIFQDPEFFDIAAGELDIGEESPCTDSGDFNVAIQVLKDFRESSRLLDHELNGNAGADMGAYERAAYLMTKTGESRTGSTVTLNTQGAPGFGLVLVGLDDGAQFYAPYGLLLVAQPSTVAIGPAFTVGDPISFTIPPVASLDGVRLAIQTLCFSSLNPARGNFTNVYRFRIFD